MLATAVKDRMSTVRDALAPPGTRPPFTADKPRAQVLDWWRKNIDTPLGQQALSRLAPADQLDLRVALAHRIEAAPLYPPEDLDAGVDQPNPEPPGTTPMPSQGPTFAPPMGPPPMPGPGMPPLGPGPAG